MGLKSGSRDSGLNETENADRDEDDAERSETDDSTTAQSTTSSTDNRPSKDSLPYILRRDNVNADRSQTPYFIRESVLEAEDDFEDELESLLGESVYKSDYREAGQIVAHRNPELVAGVLREMGYDLD